MYRWLMRQDTLWTIFNFCILR